MRRKVLGPSLRSAPRTSRRSSQVGHSRPRSAGVAQSCGDAVDREQKRSLESGLLRWVDVGSSATGEQVDLKDVDRVQVDVAHVEGAAQDRKIVEQFAARDEAELLQRECVFGGDVIEDVVKRRVDQGGDLVPSDR